MIRRALLSVSNKSGIAEFAQFLVSHNIEILSTGGTAKMLRDKKISVKDVSEYTGFPEVFDGRVKTLHPKIHGGLLYLRNNDEHQETAEKNEIFPIDLVVANLYPFEETLQKEGVSESEIIENIDIGGPSMLRSAAKNFESVTVVTDPQDYSLIQKEIGENGDTTLKTRKHLAQKVFRRTAEYDSAIAQFFDPNLLVLSSQKSQELRYGENPHQKASLYKFFHETQPSITGAKQLQGKELSFNNILDADAALSTITEFADEAPTVCIFKHLNPCGSAMDKTIEDAFQKAYEADSTSAFGGIVALNREVSAELAEKLTKIFLEIILAPSFSAKALKILQKKKNLRLLEVGALRLSTDEADIRSVAGGLLVQDQDSKTLSTEDLSVVTKKQPSDEEMQDLLFSWKICKHVKSNAIVLAKDMQTVGVGAGQMSRIDATHIALQKAGKKSKDAMCGSDAFFPFADGIESLARAGVKAIIQPGGSIRDEEVITKCNEFEIAMVFTGARAFWH